MPHIHNVRHAMVSDPGESPLTCRLPADILTSVITTTSSLSTNSFRGSFPSTFRLTAYRLPILRLISGITPLDPRTRYPVAGQPSGAGYAPARICDLCPAALLICKVFFKKPWNQSGQEENIREIIKPSSENSSSNTNRLVRLMTLRLLE